MPRQFLMVTGVLIGVYLVTANITGWGQFLGTAGNVYATGVRTLQGR